MDVLLGTAIIVLPPQHQVPLALVTAAVKVRRALAVGRRVPSVHACPLPLLLLLSTPAP